MSYRDHYQRARREKPSCYGDPDYFDPRDSECKRCKFKATCRITIDRKRDREDDRADEKRAGKKKKKTAPASRNAPRQAPDPADYEEHEEETLGFFAALTANAALSGTSTLLREAQFAVDQIPRFPYGDPFRRGTRRVLPAAEPDNEDDDE